MVQWKQIRLGIMRLQVQSLASIIGLRIQRCYELWCGLQKWLVSCVAVAVALAGGYSPNSTPSMGNSICCRCGPKKDKKKKKKKKNFFLQPHLGHTEVPRLGVELEL